MTRATILLLCTGCLAGRAAAPLPALVDWLVECGGAVANGLEQEETGHRGIVTKDGLAAGERVAMVPRGCLVTADDARGQLSALFDGADDWEVAAAPTCSERNCASAATDAEDYLALVLFVLGARRSGSHVLDPWFESLPEGAERFPVTWSAAEASLLPAAEREVLAQTVARRRSGWERATTAIPSIGDSFDFEAFLDAAICVGSRTFGVDVGGRKQSILCPLADLLNHAARGNVDWSYDADAFSLVATRRVAPSTELVVSYGAGLTQERLLLDYGFTLPGNASSVLTVTFEGAAYAIAAPRRGEVGADAKKLLQTLHRRAEKRSSRVSERLGLLRQDLQSLVTAATERMPVPYADAVVRLATAPPASPEKDALTVVVGQYGVAHTWLEIATRGIFVEDDEQVDADSEDPAAAPLVITFTRRRKRLPFWAVATSRPGPRADDS